MTLLRNETIVIKRPNEGSYVLGRHVAGIPTIIPAWSNVQPIDGDELLLVPEANRNSESLKFYSETGFFIDDVIKRTSENTAQVNTCTIDNVVDSTDYTCTLNGTTFTHNSGIGATDLSIVAALYVLIDASTLLITVIDNLDGTYTLTSDIIGDPITISVDANQSVVEDTANVSNQYRILQDKDWSSHGIPHYKVYGFLMENE